MDIRKVLVTGRLMNGLKPLLSSGAPSIEFQFLEEQWITQADVNAVDALVAFRPPQGVSLEQLQWVHSLGAGVDQFVHHWTGGKDTVLTRTVARLGEQIAEYCLSYILRDLQRHDLFHAQQECREWIPNAPRSLQGQNVLILGTGEIGRKLAQALSWFGANVYGISRIGRPAAHFQRVFTLSDCSHDARAGAVLGKTNFMICTLPHTKHTEHALGTSLFTRLHGAMFINVGRGQVIDTEALLEALKQGHVSHCVLDVFDEEPLPISSTLWSHPKVIVTPHISALTEAEDAASCCLETLHHLRNGEELSNKVDLDTGY